MCIDFRLQTRLMNQSRMKAALLPSAAQAQVIYAGSIDCVIRVSSQAYCAYNVNEKLEIIIL